MLCTLPDHNEREHEEYEALRAAMQRRFDESTPPGTKLFNVALEKGVLFDTFLANLPPSRRQHYRCTACRHFFSTYGGLITVDTKGYRASAVWPEPVGKGFFTEAITAVRQAVAQAPIDAVFYHEQAKAWGTLRSHDRARNVDWTHFALKVQPHHGAGRKSTEDAEQAMARSREEHRMLSAAVERYTPDVVHKAVNFIATPGFPSVGTLGDWIKWFEVVVEKPGPALLWRHVAHAPAGWCHVRAGLVGVVLEGILDGKGFDQIRGEVEKMAHPLAYRRAQAPPKAGNVVAAEYAFEKLGLGPALERRYTRTEDLIFLWQPKAEVRHKPLRPSTGIFAALLPEPSAPKTQRTQVPSATMTWSRFQRPVLPNAETIEVHLKAYSTYHFYFLVTAQHADAPPIVSWDTPEQRYPVTWFTHIWGLSGRLVGVKGTAWTPVLGVTPLPPKAVEKHSGDGDGVFLLLKGLTPAPDQHGGLFTAHVKSELQEFRSTIEAHVNRSTIPWREDSQAVCLAFRDQGAHTPQVLRVTTASTVQDIQIDRWD